MKKQTNAYYLDTANIKWIEEQAQKEGRSASQWLDRLLQSLRQKK